MTTLDFHPPAGEWDTHTEHGITITNPLAVSTDARPEGDDRG